MAVIWPSATLGNASIDGNYLTCPSHSAALHVRAVTTMAAGRTFFKKATLASAEEAQRETGCVIGAIPPFTFSSRIELIVDPQLTDSFSEIAFNAGRLDVDHVEHRGLFADCTAQAATALRLGQVSAVPVDRADTPRRSSRRSSAQQSVIFRQSVSVQWT